MGLSLQAQLCVVVFGIVLSFCIHLHEFRKLDGYAFPVYSTEYCPRNEREWKERSTAINCTDKNGYACLPNKNITELLEFCYIIPFIWIEEGVCLYLNKRPSIVLSYNCSQFQFGCPISSHTSYDLFENPECTSIGNGCFLAEPSCYRLTTPAYDQQTTQENVFSIERLTSPAYDQQTTQKSRIENIAWSVAGAIFGVFPLMLISLCLYISNRKENQTHKRYDVLKYVKDETSQLIPQNHPDRMESITEDSLIFDLWKQDDSSFFISTKACKEVEKLIKNRNLVIVAGHSGSGKSAIIQHIALKYREQGWTVRRVKKVEDIVDECSSSRFKKNKTICVFNDPLGKEFFDEVLYNSWQTNKEEVNAYLKTAKCVMSCRNHIICDARVTGYLTNQSHIVDIDDNKNKLSLEEKRQILNKYTSDKNLSKKECDEIVKKEKYFPLLCKLYSQKEEYKNKGIEFFTEPVAMLKEEILCFRKKDKGKYCALALLVLFNDDLRVDDLLKIDKDLENKFKHTLKLCGLPENTPPLDIGDILNSMKDFYVKKVEDTYHFYHDFVMEVTTYMFGTDYPTVTIKYADIGFLRRRVKLGNCIKHDESFTIYLSDRYIEELGERLYTELFGERLVDVVLNPCLRNEKVIKVLEKQMANHPENLQKLIEVKKLKFDEQEFDQTSKDFYFSKLNFLKPDTSLENEVSPLFALIVFCHSQLSQCCVNILQQNQINFTRVNLISAMCCNGSVQLFDNVFKDHAEEFFKRIWKGFYPIHILSVFHNHDLLQKLLNKGLEVNQKTGGYVSLTPLILAALNDTQEYEYYKHGEKGANRRDETVQVLLKNGADINLCVENGVSPLNVACKKGHDSTVQLLLSNGAYINLCDENGVSPLYAACKKGHASTVQLLLSNGAGINLCNKNGVSPLYAACGNGHDSTVQLLLSNGADIDLCDENGVSPLYAACGNGHESTVQLLLSNGADINLCDKNGVSPLYAACGNGHDSTVQLLLTNGADIKLCDEDGGSPLHMACQNGYNSTVQLLLRNGADIKLCKEKEASPLHLACFNGHDSTVQLLLSNGADINVCDKEVASPLLMACQNGHDKTVHLLLSNGADINLCDEDGGSPLYMAFQNGHNSTVQLLLRNGADIKLCKKDGVSPLHLACFYGQDKTVQLLLSNGADINLCYKDGGSPLHMACQNGYNSTVQLLLRNGADIKLCTEKGASPLHLACFNGHDSTVQLLLSNGADINLCDKEGASPLLMACQNGHDRTVQLLLSNGADINLCDEDGFSPLYGACFKRHDSTVQLLLSNGVDINLCAKNGSNPLYVACFNGHDSIVQLLLSNGANINLCAENGLSLLYIACQNGHDSTVQLLLSIGADINLSAKNGSNPLQIACFNRHDSTVQLLLSKGADINLCAENGVSPLYIACQNGHDSTVQLLLRNGADVTLCNQNGLNPLNWACFIGHDRTVQLLLSNGADINLCDEDGFSPLYGACQNGHDRTVQLLLNNGADINLCNKDGVSPLYAACQNGHDRTVQLLLNNGADINLCMNKGASPLYIACQNGHDRTVQLLLNNGADINLCMKDGISPLYIAFVNKQYNTINILLNNGVDTSLTCGWEVNPALVDCFDKYDSTVEFVMQKDNIQNNLYDPDSYFSLFVSCQVERVGRMIF